jgi:hypothetical protein
MTGMSIAWPFELGWADWANVLDSVWVRLIIAAVSLAALIGILFRIFFSTVIEAGEARWFSRNRESKPTPSLASCSACSGQKPGYLLSVGCFGCISGSGSGRCCPASICRRWHHTRHLPGIVNPLQLPAGWNFGQNWYGNGIGKTSGPVPGLEQAVWGIFCQ